MRHILFAFLLFGCVGTMTGTPELAILSRVGGDYDIAYWVRDTDDTAPVHIYIEGDGHAFDGHGRPTSDPTPHGRVARDMASHDTSPNVAYLARPCQFVMSSACSVDDWTSGRFSQKIIDEMSAYVRHIARNRPVVLIGYSGGALMSGLIIEQNPDLNVDEWITIAGVLNHSDWTEYFGDAPLIHSVDLNTLPHVSQRHYVAKYDRVVPRALSEKWVGDKKLIIVPGATHNKFPNLRIDKI